MEEILNGGKKSYGWIDFLSRYLQKLGMISINHYESIYKNLTQYVYISVM